MSKLHTVWKRITAVALIISLLPLATFEAAFDHVVYAMEEVQEAVEPDVQEAIEGAVEPEVQETVEEAVELLEETPSPEVQEVIEETVAPVEGIAVPEEQENVEDVTEWPEEMPSPEVQEVVEEVEEPTVQETVTEIHEPETTIATYVTEEASGEEMDTIEDDVVLEESYLDGYMKEGYNAYLYWDRDNNVDRYEVYRDNVLLTTISVNENNWPRYYDMGLQEGRQYSYRVEGRNESGQKVMITQEIILPRDVSVDGNTYNLDRSEIVNSVSVLGGVINLNGCVLTVCSNFEMEEGALNNGNYSYGALICNGDLLLTESAVNCRNVTLGGNMAVTGSGIRISSLVLDGDKEQTIKADDNIFIDTFVLQNYSEAGVYFGTSVKCDEFITNGCRYTCEGEGQFGYLLEEDVVFDGDYHLVWGCLDLNGHTMTVRGDFIHDGGQIITGTGSLLIEGDYHFVTGNLNMNGGTMTVRGDFIHDDGYIWVQGGSLLIEGDYRMGAGEITDGQYPRIERDSIQEGCIQVCGDTFFVNGSFEMYGDIDGFKAEGNIWIGGGALGLFSSMLRIRLIGNKKQVVDFGEVIMPLAFYVENPSDEGVFFTDILEVMEVYENGCKVSYIDEEGTNGWKLEEDTVWSDDLVLYGGTLDLNGHCLTVTGDFMHTAGTLKVNGGTLCVEGDYRTQVAREQEDGSVVYERGLGGIDLSGENDRVVVNGDVVLDTVTPMLGETKGTLELKGNLDIEYLVGKQDETMYDYGQITLVFSGEEMQEVESGISNMAVYRIINRNATGVHFGGNLCVTGMVSDETGTITSSSTIGIDSNTVIEGGTWNGNIRICLRGIYQRQVTLNQDLEVLGKLTVVTPFLLNGKTLKVKSVDSTSTIEIQGGRLLVEEMLFLDKGKLVMKNPEDYVFVGGSFIITDFGKRIGDGIQDGIIEVKGNFEIVSYVNNQYPSGEVQIGNTMIFSGTEPQVLWTCNRMAIGKLVNQNPQELRLTAASTAWQKSIHIRVLEDCVDETGTVYGNAPIYIENINQIKSNIWRGDVYVTKELDLTHDLEVKNLTIEAGGRLNGHSLDVEDLTIYRCLYTDGGEILCNGNFEINGELITESEMETVYVGGRLDIYSIESGKGGIFDVKGHVNIYAYDNSFEEFTLILSGGQQQQISGSMRIGKLINRNTKKAVVKGEVYVTEECSDEAGTLIEETYRYDSYGVYLESGARVVGGNWNCNLGIVGDVELTQDLVVGGKLIIKPGANLNVKDKNLNAKYFVVDGGLYIETGEVTCDGSFTLGTEGKLVPRESESKVLINGCFTVNTSYNHSIENVNGSIELRGNINSSTYSSEKVNLGDVTLIFSRTGSQSVNRELEVANVINRNTYSLYFSSGITLKNKLIDETGTGGGTIYLTDTSYFENGCWNGTIAVRNPISLNQNLELKNDISVYEGGILRLNGKEVHARHVYVKNGTIDIQDGILQCNYDLYVYDQGILIMQDARGRLTVGREFIFYSEIGNNGYLSAGVLEIKKTFKQAGECSFVASDEHTLLLNAKDNKVSLVMNYPELIHFNNVVINNAKKYYSLSTPLESISNRVIIDYDLPVNKLDVSDVSYTTAKLTYGVPSGSVVTEYAIYRNGEEVATTKNTTYVDKELKPGTKYVYEVYPRNDWGALAKSSPKVEITTKSDTEAPVLKGNPWAKLRTGSSITVAWNAATDNVGVEGYTVYRDGEEIATGVTDTFYKDTTAQENTVYYYSITAYDACGNVSTESGQVETSLGMPEITALYPEPGKNVKADVLNLSVRFRDYGNSTGNQVKIEYLDALGEWKQLAPTLLQQKKYNNTTLYVEYAWDVTHVTGVQGYTLRYTLYDADGNTDVEQVTYFVDRQLPKAPENLIAIADNGTIVLSWERSVTEDCNSYKVYRKTAADGEFTLLGTVSGKNNTSYTDKAVTENETYMYAVTAVDVHAYESEYSAEVTKTADADLCPPEIKEILPKTGTVNKTVTVQVKATDNKEAAAVTFYFRTEEETEWTELGTVSLTSGKAEYALDTTQYDDGVYYIGVEAVDAAGNRSPEKETRRYQFDNTGIAKIVLTECTASSTQVQLKWEDVTEADFSYFRVEQLKGEDFVSVGTVSNVLGYTVENLAPNTVYSFRVVGYDKLGNRGEASEVCEVTTEADTIKPSIKSVLPVASYYKDSLALSVRANDNHALEKAVFSYSTDGVNFVETAIVYGAGKQSETFYHTMSLRAFDEGSLYIKFEVYDTSGNKNLLPESGEEIIVEYKIDRTAPAKVEGLTRGSNEGYVELNWTPGAEEDVKYYRIYRANGQSGSFYLHVSQCNTKNYYDTSVKAGESYRYKVSAVDIAGNEGLQSEEIAVTVAADTEAPVITGITPKDGETVGKQAQLKVVAVDSASLAQLKIEYQRAGETLWNTLTEQQISGKSHMATVNWNTVTLSEGSYNLRFTVTDMAGNVSEVKTAAYTVDHTAPTAPELTAETGHFEIKLTMDGEKPSDFGYYEVYRRKVGASSFTRIATVTDDSYTDTSVETGIIYFYQVTVYDAYGNSAKSGIVECVADDVDVVAPVAVLTQKLMGLAGMEVAFDGMGCSDNVRITRYVWDMGDGTTKEGPQPVHIYQEAGTYQVTLTVTDGAGNTAQAGTTVEIQEKTGRGSSVVRVVDERGNGIPYASIYVATSEEDGFALKANSRGLVTIVAEGGTYNVAAYANTYLPGDIDVTVSEYEVKEYTLSLVQDELIVGELTVRRMELEEMLEAGVDFSDPENYNRFVFNVQLTFAQSPLPVEINYVSGSGGATYTYSGGGSGGSTSSRTVHVQEIKPAKNQEEKEPDPVPILAYVSTTQHVSWLKEMYEVELGILNAADSRYTIEDSVATLNLPKGVSLAKLVGGQSLTQDMGTIRGQERKSVSWVVKGDESGTYSLSADFEGTLMPFKQKVSARFETESEFEVNTGEGLHIYIMPEKSAYIGREYYIQFKIVNESDRPLYKFSTSIGPYEEPIKEYTVINEDTGEVITTTSVPIAVSTGTNLRQAVVVENGQKIEFAALFPGESFYGTYKTTFTGEGDPAKVYYKLIESLVTVLEGENLGVEVTVLPIESHIYQTRFRTVVLPSYYGDPVNITNGYFTEDVAALAVNGATSIGLDMHYSSGLAGYRGDLGFGWYHDYEMGLQEQNGIIWYYGSPGAKVSFLHENAMENTVYGTIEDGMLHPAEGEEYSYGTYYSQSQSMEDYRIVKHEDGTYTMYLPNGMTYGFDTMGRLVKITDTDGKSVSLSYSENRMTLTDDLSGKQVYYNYNSLGFIGSVTDDNGREIKLTYDERGCLTSYTDPIGNTITYVYDEQHRILEAANAKGTYVVNVYDDNHRVTEQTDARGGVMTFSYRENENGMVVTIVDAAGVEKQAAMDANGRMLYVINENGGKTTYTYDEKGNLLTEEDSYGNVTSRTYDEKGNIVKLTECGGNTTVMTYDAKGNLLTVSDAEGNTASYTYDGHSRMTSKTDYNGCVTTYEYNADGLLVKETTEGLGSVYYTYENGMCVAVTDYLGRTTYTEYDGMGNLIRTTDADGKVISYEFNAAGQMVSAKDNQGNVTTYRYDCNSNLIAFTDGGGNTTTYEYDAAGNQTAVCYPDGTKTTYTYDSMGRCVEICYADDTKERMAYDASGNLTKKFVTGGGMVAYKYDLLNRCVEAWDADGNSTTYEYYPNGKVSKETYADGSSLTYTYNASGKPETVTDHTGATVTYEYDVKGNVISEKDALNNTRSYVYDAYGRLTEERDANGNTTTYEYDANSNCIKKTNALGVSVHMTYDKRNRLTEVYTETKDGEVYKVSYEYDSLGRVVAVTDEEGNVSRMTYDALGNVTSVTDAKGCVRTVSTYDSMGRTATVTDALGITAEYSYDTVGNLLSVTELLNGQASRLTSYSYDALGRLTGVTDPLDGVTSEVYNEVGELVSRTDANGGTTTYTYDTMGRLLTELNPIGSKTSYAYNAQGLLSELTNARGQKTSYAYDGAGRVTSLTDELGTVSYEYDANGNVLKVTDENGSIERKYDALNRITEYTDYNGNTVKYAYDEIGNLISLTYPGGEIVRYTYYKNGWLETVTDSEGRVTSYEYDANGNLTHTTRANGTEEFCTYNEAGLLVEQKDVKGEEVLTHYTYTYDARGNIASVEGTETAEGGLTRLVSATMTYDAANRLITYNGEKLHYDADGNMTYGPVKGEMSELIYDCRNRLVSAGGVTYSYDAENTRISAETESYREVYVTESVSSSLSRILSTTRYEKTAGEVALDGVTTLYVYGNGLIYEYTDDAVLYHHYNNLGSTTKLTDATGAVVATYTYGTYGELLSGDTTLTRFLYNGRCGVSTDDNGLYYMRQRYYNPEIKRFVNQDILTGSISNSQSLNRYSYVQGNPVSYTDPFGLSPLNGLFSGTMLIHTVCGLLGWVPGPVGAIANAVDGLVYLFVDKDIKNALYSFGSTVFWKAGSIVKNVGKGSKTALNIQRACNAIGSGINFAQSAEGTYQTASMMADKYIVQGQPLSLSTVGELGLLAANVFGAYKSGTNTLNDLADVGSSAVRSWKAWRNAKNSSGSNKVHWGKWEDYRHVTIGDKEYAEIGERVYTRHAVARMQPSGMRYTNASAGGKVKASRIINAGDLDYGRGISPNYIEDIINTGKVTPQVVDGVPRTVFSSGTVDVITEQDGRMIVTILTH